MIETEDRTDSAIAPSDDDISSMVYITGEPAGQDDDNIVGELERMGARALADLDKATESDKAKIKASYMGPAHAAEDEEEQNKHLRGDYEEGMFGRWHTYRLGISDYGGHMKLEAKGPKDPRTHKRVVSDAQLERMVVKGVLQKGWSEMYIMTNGRIDTQLTERAKRIAEELSRPGGPLEGRELSFRHSLPDECGWHSNAIRRWAHECRKRQERRATESRYEEVKRGMHEKDAVKNADNSDDNDQQAAETDVGVEAEEVDIDLEADSQEVSVSADVPAKSLEPASATPHSVPGNETAQDNRAAVSFKLPGL